MSAADEFYRRPHIWFKMSKYEGCLTPYVMVGRLPIRVEVGWLLWSIQFTILKYPRRDKEGRER